MTRLSCTLLFLSVWMSLSNDSIAQLIVSPGPSEIDIFGDTAVSNTVLVTINGDGSVDITGNGQVFPTAPSGLDIVITCGHHGDHVEIFGATRRIEIKFYGGEGNDYFNNHTGTDSFVAGSYGDDDLFGGSGSDFILAYYGDDVVDGGDGDDFLAGQHGDDLIFGGNGDDECTGGGGSDTVFGGPGNDIIRGYDSFIPGIKYKGIAYEVPDFEVDQLNGGPGNDTFYHAFYYWKKYTYPAPFPPISVKVYHEQDNIQDFNVANDQQLEKFFPNLPIVLFK